MKTMSMFITKLPLLLSAKNSIIKQNKTKQKIRKPARNFSIHNTSDVSTSTWFSVWSFDFFDEALCWICAA